MYLSLTDARLAMDVYLSHVLTFSLIILAHLNNVMQMAAG